MTALPDFGGVVLPLPFAGLAMRTVLDAIEAQRAADPPEDADMVPHVAEIAVQMVEADADCDLCDAFGTLLVLRSLGQITFPDTGGPCVLTARGRRLLALGDRLTELG